LSGSPSPLFNFFFKLNWLLSISKSLILSSSLLHCLHSIRDEMQAGYRRDNENVLENKQSESLSSYVSIYIVLLTYSDYCAGVCDVLIFI